MENKRIKVWFFLNEYKEELKNKIRYYDYNGYDEVKEQDKEMYNDLIKFLDEGI